MMDGETMFACEDCKHYKNGVCEYEIDLYETDDAYDCTKFEINCEKE